MVSRSLVVFLVACGGSSGNETGDVTPFIGMYSTTSHTRAGVQGDNIKCADPGQPVTNATPYFRLAVYSFFQDPDVLSVSNCTDAAGTACTETSVTLRAGGPGLEEENANSSTGDGSLCQLYFTHTEATLTGGTIEIETLDKYASPSVSSSDCTLQRAEALASSPDCREVERWVGARQ